MFIRRLFPLLLTTAMLLAGCAGATPPATSAPTATNVPTVAPTVTAVAHATTPPTTVAAPSTTSPTETPLVVLTPAAIATAADHDLIPADQINDQTEARLRLAHLVSGGPNVDLIVNGAVAVNGGQAQVNIPADYYTAYLYLRPGTYPVAVVPTGHGLADAILGPLDVPLLAGHRYTLALMGQIGDKNLKPLVIDETAVEIKAGATATDSVRIWVNNLALGTAIDASGGGNPVDLKVPYGSAVGAVYPAGNFHPHAVNVLLDVPTVLDFYDEDWNEPGSSTLTSFVGFGDKSAAGGDPTGPDYFDAPPISQLNIIDFLQGFSGKHVVTNAEISFDTLLAALKTAGLTDMLKTGGPYYLLAPTDSAFAALPKKQLDALLADPQALANLLRNHIVAQYIPRGSLSKTPGGVLDRTLTNLLGAKLTIGDGYTVNGANIGDFNAYFVANGSYVKVINTVLMPATK